MSKKIWVWLLLLVVLVLVQSVRDQSLVTGQAPVISAQVFNQKNIQKTDAKGPNLIYFWASWCGICKTIQGTMQGILLQYPSITVAMKSGNEQVVRQYLQAESLDWPFVVDPQGLISAEFGVSGVPTIFILDRNGNIRFTAVGYSSSWGLDSS